MVAWGSITTVVLGAEQGWSPTVVGFIQSVLGFKHGVTNHLWFLAAMSVLLMVLPMILSVKGTDESLFRKMAWAAVATVFGLDLFTRFAQIICWLTDIEAAPVLATFLSEFAPLRGNTGLGFSYLLLGMLIGGEGKPCWGKITSLVVVVAAPMLQTLYAVLFIQNGAGESYDPIWSGYTFVGTAALVVAMYSLAATPPRAAFEN